MLFDSIKLTEGSSISNMTVSSGVDFPAIGDLGELYFHVPDSKLYVYTGSSWDAIGTSTTLAGLATVARTGIYADLINKPVYATVAETGSFSDLANVPTYATVASSGSYSDLINRPSLASVATSGSYADLSAKPTIASLGGVASTAVGVANGVAALDSAGLVPSGQLPSYVDDVVEFDTLATFPVTGERGKIYVTLNDSKIYRWSGTQYVEIIASPGTTDAIVEGTVNLYFTPSRAYTASPVKYVAGRQGSITLTTADIGGLSNVAKTGLYTDIVNAPVLATVATSGSFNDLTDKPALSLTGDITSSGLGPYTTTLATVNTSPAANVFRKVSVNGKGLVTATSAVVEGDITSALGFTPYNSTNPDGYITSASIPVQSVAGKTGVVTLVQADIAGLTTSDSPTFFNVTATLTGNATSASKLSTPRAINGVAFDGTGAITVTSAAGTLTGNTLNSTVTGSSLTSVGTLSGLTSSGAVSITNTTNATGANTGALKVAGGASIGGDVYIAGSMMVAGSLTTVSSSVITVTDPMLYLGSGNTSDVVDLGIVAAYTSGGEKHAGVIRDASDGTWKFFDAVSPEPTSVVDFTSAVYSPVKMGSLTATSAALTSATITDSASNPKLTLVRTGSTGNVQIQYVNDSGSLYSGIEGTTFAWGANANLSVSPFLTLTSTAANFGGAVGVVGELTANDLNIIGNAASYNSQGGLNISNITGSTGTIEYKAYSNSGGTGGVSHAFKIGNSTSALINSSGISVTGAISATSTVTVGDMSGYVFAGGASLDALVYGSGSSKYVSIWTAGAERLKVTNAGLAVTGQGSFTRNATAGQIMSLSDGVQQNLLVSSDAGIGTAGTISLDSVNSGAIAIKTGSVERGRFSSTGLAVDGTLSATGWQTNGNGTVVNVTTSAAYNRLTSSAGSFYLATDNAGGNSFAPGGVAYAVNYYADNGVPHIWSISGAEKLRLDASGNLGLGVVPSNWGSGYKSIDLNNRGFGLGGGQDSGSLSVNAYYDISGTWKYKGTSAYRVTRLDMFDGGFIFNTAPSGTAGNPITFTPALSLDSSGNLDVKGKMLTVGGMTGYSSHASEYGGSAMLGSIFGDVPTSGTLYVIETGTSKYLNATFYKADSNSVPVITVLASSGLFVEAANNQGTVQIGGYTVGTNVKQRAMIYSIGSGL